MTQSVIVARFSFPLDANIAKSTLESVGIPAFIADEHTVNMQWLYSNAMGGVRLFVPAEYLEEAKEVLNHDFSESVDLECGSKAEICPECGSKNLVPYTQGKRSAFLVFLLAGFPLFFYKHGLKCQECGCFLKSNKNN